MKITLLTPALVAILGLALACPSVHAQTNSSASSTPAPTGDATPAPAGDAAAATAPSDTKFHGTVSAIDATAKTLAVKGKDGDVSLSITDDTKGGDLLSTLAVGDKVSGSYTTDASGKMTATKLKKAKAKDAGAKGDKKGAKADGDAAPAAE